MLREHLGSTSHRQTLQYGGAGMREAGMGERREKGDCLVAYNSGIYSSN